MIFDGENMFLDGKALSASTITSNVINVGPGESGDAMHLVLAVSGAGTGTATTALETSATEDFTSKTVLGEYTKVPLSVQIPRGNLGYLRLSVTSTYTTGTVTAALVLDDNIDQ
jgi:hypothetical protein